jgi:NADH-quinone oxidoreductase subunit M
VYILLPYQRIFTGPKVPELARIPDLGAREKWVVGPLVAVMLALGFYPAPVIDAVRPVAQAVALEQPSSIDTARGPAGPADSGAVLAAGPEGTTK